jgi:hypothetical protein
MCQAWWYNTCNPSTQKAEAGRLQVQDQPGLHSETLALKIKGWDAAQW